ncbi:orexin receptor type 2-like [Haliotis cracherodii]|uniref:orexin receptor type 2-like n=1 Tax=Haliotis cracherodii TaxID=6455 RepID=UPI0039E8DC9C
MDVMNETVDYLTGNMTGNDTDDNKTNCWNEYCLNEEDYLDAIKEHLFPRAYEWPIIIVFILTFILGLVGNFLVVYAVWKNHSMRTVTNVFIVNLALGDFMVILVCLPSTLISDVLQTWFLGSTICKILIFLQNVSVSVSVLTLSAISVERWYAICHPLAFKSTLSRARNIIIVIWVVAAGVALPEMIVVTTNPYNYPGDFQTIYLTTCAPAWLEWKQIIYQISLVIVMYVCPLVLMALTYTNIAVVLWRNDIPGQAEMGQYSKGKKPMIEGKGKSQEDKIQSRRKAAKMLITIVIVFSICYLPVHILNILRYFKILLSTNNDVAAVQSQLSHWLPYFNSALNPVIYNFMSAKFRKEFKLACYCCLRPWYKTNPRRRDGTFTMTFSNSNYSNCHTEEVTLTSFKD